MILFVFEGQKREPLLFNTMKRLFFANRADTMICTYASNIYSLYRKLKDLDTFDKAHEGDTVSVLKEILIRQNDNTLSDWNSSDFSEIFLFFDYDYQESAGTMEENNRCVHEMLEYFDDETMNGKLYIHYPMVESICYTQALPDKEYVGYVVSREECGHFKRLTERFSFYKSYDHLLIPQNASNQKQQATMPGIRQNWEHLIRMNVGKAHFLCKGVEAYPEDKTSVKQMDIYENQLQKYVERIPSQVSVLNSFPLFLYEYFPTTYLHLAQTSL